MRIQDRRILLGATPIALAVAVYGIVFGLPRVRSSASFRPCHRRGRDRAGRDPGRRMAGLALLPVMSPRVAAVLDRTPAALFAGLAMRSIVTPGPEVAAPGVLAAAAGALVVAPLRSMPAHALVAAVA